MHRINMMRKHGCDNCRLSLRKFVVFTTFVTSSLLLVFLGRNQVSPGEGSWELSSPVSEKVSGRLSWRDEVLTEDSDSELGELLGVSSTGEGGASTEDSNSEESEGVWPVVLKHSDAQALKYIDYSQYSPQDREFLASRAEVYITRARVLRKACEKRKLGTEIFKFRLLWDETHSPSIVWCPIYKVASTTWLTNFLRLAHFNEEKVGIPTNVSLEEQEHLRFLAKYGAKHSTAFSIYHSPDSIPERIKLLKKSLRVIIVRHPFIRLLSAYRDKMTKEAPHPKQFGFRELQKSIIAKYRQPDAAINSTFPTFSEFVQYVIDSTEKLHTAMEWRKNVKCWAPYWAHCSVCTLDYNVIMKLETMQEDERFLVTISRLEELKGNSHWHHLRHNSSSELTDQFFGQLTRRQMELLHRRYQPDFDFFDYDIKDFLAIAKE